MEGTFALIWKKKRGSMSSAEDEQELHEKSTATLFEMGLEGGKEHLAIRKRDGVTLEKTQVSRHLLKKEILVVCVFKKICG